MGSGTNRKWWQEVRGSRTAGRAGSKSRQLRQRGDMRWKKMKDLRAEAARRSNS